MTILDHLQQHGRRVIEVLRIIAGFLFIAHGTQKLFITRRPPAEGRRLCPGRVGRLLGCRRHADHSGAVHSVPRPFILSGLMAVGYFMVHAPGAFCRSS